MKNPAHTRRVLALACLAALANPAVSQNAAPTQDQPADASQATSLETVTVTGTRISNPNVISPTPISVLNAADIKATGAINIGDLMTTMPQLATSFTMGNSTRYIGTAGVAMQDLRNLGTSRTLVLVNGRRFVGSSAGDTAVDVNLIPADWVERVEIITGGASAVYGADAVTGVVNFILKKNYQGANLHAQYGTSEHGGLDKKLLSLTGGMNFADSRGNVAVSVEHSDQSSLEFPDRFGNKSYQTINKPYGIYDSALYNNAGGYTNLPGGTFSLGGASDTSKRYVFNPDGSVRKQNFYGPYDTARCNACDRNDVNQVLQLEPQYSRTTLSSVARFDITPEQHLYAEGTYSHIDVKKYGQPAFGSGGSAYVITRDNAYVDPTLAALMDANNLKSIKVARFDVDAGRRGEDTGRDTTRGVVGANGLISGDWEYDTSLVYGVMDETRHNLNNRINDRFYASIDAVRDANGNIVCRSSLNPNAINANAGGVLDPVALGGGCIPTSIFGAGAINPVAAQWFNTTTTTKSRLTQFVGGGTVTNNNLFQMPFEAGTASLAAGVEFRRETSRELTDPLDVAGLTFLNAIPPSSGSYDVKEGYIEAAMPLLSGRPFAQNLTFDAAARFSDYSTVGHTRAWRWGLDWSINSSLRLRGTMSSAVRAPNIGELFGGQSQNYFSISKDPCSATELKNAHDRNVRAANCAALGIPANWNSSNTATIEGVSGSNPDLKPEQGRTWTAGLVFTPDFLPGFGITADYWSIRLTDAISAPGGVDISNHCVDSTTGINNIYCANARRGADHELNYINSIYQNISALSTSGMDIGAYYNTDVGPGKLRLAVDATRVMYYTEHPFQDDPSNTVQYNGTLGFPKWKGMLRSSYNLNNWLFNWNMRYFSSMLRVSNESYEANPTQTTPIRAGAGFFNDAKVGYSFPASGWQAYFGVTNVFDRDPPVNLFGTGFGSGLYDSVGRAYYAGFNYNF